jgi:ABC-2 type transport system ATP-binding protein/lipopolysaccharide transport system ATP-binding protein
MTAIRLRDVCVDFPIYQGGSRSLKKTLMRAGAGGRILADANQRLMVHALDRISLDIEDGDRVALIGPNGAGKTTLLRVLAGTYEPTAGQIQVDGHVAPLFDSALGLNPDATGYENIVLRGVYMGMSPREMSGRMEEIAAFTELGDYLRMPIRSYSSGMLMRLAFGVATCVHPEILLMDEWLLAGDAHFMEKARGRLASFVTGSRILVLASHSELTVREWCNKALFLERGQIRGFGPVDEILAAYAESVRAA